MIFYIFDCIIFYIKIYFIKIEILFFNKIFCINVFSLTYLFELST
jgi:hypothetical protein